MYVVILKIFQFMWFVPVVLPYIAVQEIHFRPEKMPEQKQICDFFVTTSKTAKPYGSASTTERST